MVHAPAAASCPEIAFASILGRREEATSSLAAKHRAQPFLKLAEFLDSVDIVGIAVPPGEQPRFAMAAAKAGKHLLLEKPVAMELVAAEAITSALTRRGLASVTFFPQLILPETSRWIDNAVQAGDWFAATLERFSQTLVDSYSPFHGSSWRLGTGAIWDTAPHAVALLLAVLGELAEVSAVKGRGDLVVLTLVSTNGAIATLALMRDASAPFPGRTIFHGPSGVTVFPTRGDWNADSTEACRIALRALAAAANGRPGMVLSCDASFGARVTAVLAAAAKSLEERRFVGVSPRPV